MQIITWPLGHPALDCWSLMGPVVVKNQMNLQIARDHRVRLVQKVSELDCPVTSMTFPDNLSCLDIKGSKQRRGAMTGIVMSTPFDLTRPHGQNRLAPTQGLNLRFSIHTKHHGSIRRIQTKSHLFDKQRIFRQFEGLAPMGLKRKGTPNSTDGTLSQSRGLGHRTGTSMGRIFRGRLQGSCNHPLDVPIGNLSRNSRTRLIQQTIQPICNKRAPPFSDGWLSHVQGSSHFAVHLAFGTRHNKT
jgi:hypothetical protein